MHVDVIAYIDVKVLGSVRDDTIVALNLLSD